MHEPLLSGERLSCVLLIGSAIFSANGQTPDELLLKDYRPRSIYKIPETRVEKARYPAIDVHSHNLAPKDEDIDRWVATMDQVGLQKTIVLSGNTGPKFHEVLARYRKYPKRFEVWCGFDYTGFDEPGFGPAA